MKRLFSILLILACCGLVFSQTRNTMYVAVKSAALKASTGFFGRKLASLGLGSAVTVVRQNGKWMEVRTADSLSGWMASASLTTKRVTGQGHSASAGEIALAGKGFSAEIEAEYRKNGLDYAAVDSMENLTVPETELAVFISDGHLNNGE